jgi:hypothetical protein
MPGGDIFALHTLSIFYAVSASARVKIPGAQALFLFVRE